jgi:hypothetical protein
MLRFPDDTQVSVIGLSETMADLYSEGRQANNETAEEIIKRLEALNNYVPSSDRTRREYAYVLLTEYREYVESRIGNNRKQASDPG